MVTSQHEISITPCYLLLLSFMIINHMRMWRWTEIDSMTWCFFSPSVSFEFGRAVWLRFYPSAYPPCPHPSFVAHLGGVAVGITLGVVILRNYEQRLQDQSLWWIFVSMYVVFVVFAIFWNIFAYNLLDLKLPPPPWEPGLRNNKGQTANLPTANCGEDYINLRIYFSMNIRGYK